MCLRSHALDRTKHFQTCTHRRKVEVIMDFSSLNLQRQSLLVFFKSLVLWEARFVIWDSGMKKKNTFYMYMYQHSCKYT